MNIQLRFVTQDDLISKLIRDYTFSPFSHVEFVILDAIESLGIPANSTIGAHHADGVAIRPINYAKFSVEERFYVPMSEQQGRDLLLYLHQQVGKPYDTEAIIGMMLRRDWREDDSWFCSELVAACFEKAGYPLLHAGCLIDRIAPRDCYLSTLLVPQSWAC